jgi:hypothetical protein
MHVGWYISASYRTLLSTLPVGKTVLRTTFSSMNGVFWDVTPCDSCNNRRLEET